VFSVCAISILEEVFTLEVVPADPADLSRRSCSLLASALPGIMC
jgi:hypothetical protein